MPKAKTVKHSTQAQDKEFCAAWRVHNGNVQKVAEALKLTRQAVYNRLESMVVDTYYVMPVGNYWQAIAVNHTFKRVWIATGKMSRSAAENYVNGKRAVQTVTYTTRGGTIVTVPKYAPKVIFMKQQNGEGS